MLVKRELIITGDSLEKVLADLMKAADAAGHGVEDIYHEGYHYVRVSVGDADDFAIEENDYTLRVWPGFQGDEEERHAWNQMLEEFYEQVVKPVCKAHHVAHELTTDEKDIGDFFSHPLVELLDQVVLLPDSSNTRWNLWSKFLVLAIRESGGAYDDELYEWLIEKGQSEKMALKMLDDFHHAHWILDSYFRQFPEHKPDQQIHPEAD